MSVVKRFPKERIEQARKALAMAALEDRLDEVLGLVEKAYREKPWLLSGKTAAGILSGLVYAFTRRCGAPLTQFEVAMAFNVTEVTVRKSYYRIWEKVGL